MNYGEIKKYDIANGEGVRVSLFVSGCTHHCPGCFNQETWDFGFGKPYTEETEREILEALAPGYIAGLSLLGGECYTGYLFDRELLEESRARCRWTDEMLSMIDVLVDGRFVEAKKDITLLFRGSSNQRLINVQESLRKKEVVLYEPGV